MIISGIYGLSMASTFPTTFILAENTIKINGKIASFMIFGGATGELVIPLIVGNILDYYGIGSFVMVTFVLSMIMALVLGVISILTPRVIRNAIMS